MARLLRHLEEKLYVQQGLCVHGGTDCPEFRDDEMEAGLYRAAVRLEAWDSEPPGPGPSWRLIGRPAFTAETGMVQIGVMDDMSQDFLIGPPLFAYGLTAHVGDPECDRWLFRFWPVRDVFDPLVHMKPRAPAGAGSPGEPRRVPVPVSTAGEWAAMRPDRFRGPEESVPWTATPDALALDSVARTFGLRAAGRLLWALNPDHAPTFELASLSVDGEVDFRDEGGTYRMWRWERETADGRPGDGNLLTGRAVHARDRHRGWILVSGIVTVLDTTDGRHHVRDAEPHEAARVTCAEATWPP